MSLDYYKRYADNKTPTPQKSPERGGKSSAPKPVVFTESTKKRKKTVTKNNQIVDKTEEETSSTTKTPYKEKKKKSPDGKTATKTLSNTRPKIAKIRHNANNNNTLNKTVQNNKNTTTTTTTTTTKTPAKTTSPNKTTANPNLKSKRPTKKPKKTNNNIIIHPLEFRISTEEEFKEHFELVIKTEFEKVKHCQIGNKVNGYLESFLTSDMNDNEDFAIGMKTILENIHNHIFVGTHNMEWQELLNEIKNTDDAHDNNDFIQQEIVKFSKLKKEEVKQNDDDDDDKNIQHLIEDILLQSDALILDLKQVNRFMKKGDKYFSDISSLVREKELIMEEK